MPLDKSADLMSYKYDYYNGLRRFTPDAKITVPEHLNLLSPEEQDDFLLYNKVADITDANGQQEYYNTFKRFNELEFQKLPLANKLITLRAYKNFYGTDKTSEEVRKYYKIKHNSIKPGHVYHCDVRHIKYVAFSRYSRIEDIFDKCLSNTTFAKLLIDVVLLELITHLIKLKTLYLWPTVIQLFAENIVSHIDRYVCVKVLAQFLLGLLHTVPHDDGDEYQCNI
nr:maco-A 108 [Mamestra configurata nucleopolyhedrovirus A]